MNHDKAYREHFLFDIKNMICLRLFATDHYILLKKNDIKSVSDLKSAISASHLSAIDNLPSTMTATLQNGTFRENLVFVHENQRLLDIDDLSKILKDGPS